MVRQLAWRLQEEAFGGHDRETLKLLDSYSRQDAKQGFAVPQAKAGYVSRERVPGRPPCRDDQRRWLRLAGQDLHQPFGHRSGNHRGEMEWPRFGLRAQDDGKAAVRKAS